MQGENRLFYQEEDYEFSFMDLVWYILYQWRIILLVMVIMGIILGGYGGLKEFQKFADKEQVQKSQETYDTAVLAYESQKSQLENKLKRLAEDLDQQKSYEENCLMLQIDPYNVFIHSASYYINTNYEIVPELFYQNPNYTSVITNSYRSAIDRIDFDAVVATKEQPLLTVKNPTTTGKRMVTTSTDAGNGILNITVFADTQERADALFNVIDETLKAQEILLNKVIGEHTLGVLSEETYVDVDGDFSALQDSFANKTATINDGITKTNQALIELAEPVDSTPSIISVLKQLVKFGIVGAVAGLVLVAGFFFVRFLIQDMLISTPALESRYNLPVLGIYHNRKKRSFKIDDYCEKQMGIYANPSLNEQIQYIVSNLLLFQKTVSAVDKIILVGNVPLSDLHDLKELLQTEIKKEVLTAGNILANPQAIAVMGADSIVIDVEAWGRSVHRDIRKAFRLIKASGNINAGFIIIR